jgi:quercetin dioxygenase-like cupin family protein
VKLINYLDCKRNEQGLGAFQRTLLDNKDEAKNIRILMWELEPGVTRPIHTHANEHGAIVLAGNGVLSNGKEKIQLKKDDVFFLSSQEPHEITNSGKSLLRYVFFNPIAD